MKSVRIEEYLDRNGSSLFAKWLDGLNAPAAAKVAVTLVRIEQGNFSSVKGVGSGVCECRIDFGPGYRVYFGKDGEALVILWAAAQRSARKKIFRPRMRAGKTTRRARREEQDNVIDPGL